MFPGKSALHILRVPTLPLKELCGRFTIDLVCEFLLGTSIINLQELVPRAGKDLSNILTPGNKFFAFFRKCSNRDRCQSTYWYLLVAVEDIQGTNPDEYGGSKKDSLSQLYMRR